MKLDFVTFIEQAKNTHFWADKKVVCFKGSTNYPSLFFAELFSFLQSTGALPANLKKLPLDSVEKKDLLVHLNQSFLGQGAFYWLTEFAFSRSLKNSLELFHFLIDYKGANFVSFYVKDEKISVRHKNLLKNIFVVAVQEEIDFILFEKVLTLFEKNIVGKKFFFAKKIFKQVGSLFLDKALLLSKYLELINEKKMEDFYKDIVEVLVAVSPRLNLLSKYFFEKQSELFFTVWSQVYKDYPDMFWISFWADKIWRAYHFVKFCKQKNFRQARVVGVGLPFMFIKRDWQNFSLNKLSNYYQFLYNSDFRFKNGSIFCSLDLFYLNHFVEK